MSQQQTTLAGDSDSMMTNQRLSQCLVAVWQKHLENLSGEPCLGLYDMTISVAEKELLTFVYQHCKGNLSLSAKMLGISRTTMSRKLIAYQIR